MSIKRRYSPPRGRDTAPPRRETYVPRASPRGRGDPVQERCTCWVLTRGEGPQVREPETADCELVPDPACPVHGKKHYPILEEDWSW